jgi:WS/DGAT/MGAT family acyltransferase
MANYERLSGLDEAFLEFETSAAYMHVAVTAIFEAAPLRRADGGLDADTVRRHLESRLDRLPRFRQRLAHVPVVADALWVDDEHFDIGAHVRHTSLPKPGSDEQLRQRSAEILERPLDRRRPLWETWIVEGLAEDRFALVVKVHHCMVDGIAGVGMLACLLGPEPEALDTTASVWTPRPHPSERELLRDEVLRRARGLADAGTTVVRSLGRPAEASRELRSAAAAVWRLALSGANVAPQTPFNRPIGPHRDVAWLTLDLERVKQVKRRLGGTVNDLVLGIVAGGLSRLLSRSGQMPAGGTVRIAVPVSTRTADEAGNPGNHVSIWMVPVPVAGASGRRRLRVIQQRTAELKAQGQAAGAAVLTRAADWTGAALRNLAIRLIRDARIYNLIVTNVPGPPMPLYLLGCQMVAAYPHLPLFENQGLGMALLSYRSALHVGLTADWEQRDLLHQFAGDLESAFDEFAAAAGIDVPADPCGSWRAGPSMVRNVG